MEDTVKVTLLQDIPYFGNTGEVKTIAACQLNTWIECGTAVLYIEPVTNGE